MDPKNNGLTIETNNFAFEVNHEFRLPACMPDEEANDRTSYRPVGAGTGAELRKSEWNGVKDDVKGANIIS